MKIKVECSIGLVGCRKTDEIEVPDEELEGMSETEKSDHLNEYTKDWAMEQFEYWYEECGDDK